MKKHDVQFQNAKADLLCRYIDECIATQERVDLYIDDDVICNCVLIEHVDKWLSMRNYDIRMLVMIENIVAIRKRKDGRVILKSCNMSNDKGPSFLSDIRAQYMYDLAKNPASRSIKRDERISRIFRF